MLQEEEKLIKQGEDWRRKGHRIQLQASWLRDGDKQFIMDVVEGRMDGQSSGNILKEDKLAKEFTRINIRDDDEQGK